MIPRRKKRLMLVLSMVFGVAIAISFILYALSNHVDLFYTPSQMVEGDKRPQVGQRLRVGGMVVEGSVKRDATTLEVEFLVTDIGPTVKVLYRGILPDLFREGQGIVAQGVLLEPNVLQASEVLAKHDEEYMPPELAEAMKGIKHVNPNSDDAYTQPPAPKPSAGDY